MNIRKTKGFYLHLTEHRVSNFKHLHCQLPKTMYYTFTVNFRKPCTKTCNVLKTREIKDARNQVWQVVSIFGHSFLISLSKL